MLFALGNQIIGIVSEVDVLDGNGNPIRSELMEPETAEHTVWKQNCLLEVQLSAMPGRVEDVTATTTTTKQVAWAFFPADSDSSGITQSNVLRLVETLPSGVTIADLPDGVTITTMPTGVVVKDYDVRGNGVTEVDKFGVPDYVFCMCEAQGG